MSQQPAPAAFSHLVNLAADETGTFVLWASDDYFAEKENLVRSDAPVWKEGVYTDKGKWMDGWESQRMRGPGHDTAILRLGVPGSVEGLLVDTTHFKGNAPIAVALEVCEAPHTATAEELLSWPVAEEGAEGAAQVAKVWRLALPKTDIRSDFGNVIALPQLSPRATHVRLHIYPDGGVARLRVYGVARPAPQIFWQQGSIDLAAIEHGGRVTAISDAFFGPPANLLLPGRGVNMGDGWETRRRRTPGSDWCEIGLGRRGLVQRIEVDTHFFKGNAPQACSVFAFDAGAVDPDDAEGMAAAMAQVPTGDDAGWTPLLDLAPLVQHRRHSFEPARPTVATHLRVHIFPHGGVNRMRVFGLAAPTPREQERLATLQALPRAELDALLLSFCGATAWAQQVARALPSCSQVRDVLQAVDVAFWALRESDWLEAFAAHPRIGARKDAAAATAQSAQWSRGEQAQVHGAESSVTAMLATLNETYFERFGFIFIVFATGRSAAQMLALLQRRIGNDREAEIRNAGDEQARITRLRLENWLLAG